MGDPHGVEVDERVDRAPGAAAGTAVPPARVWLLRHVPGIGSDLGLGHNNLVIFWAMLFNELSFGFYQTLAPIYIESLGASPGLVGLVLGIQYLVRLLYLAPAGMLADRLPLRTLIVAARSMSVVGLVLYGLAGAWWHLFPAILVLSAGNIAFPAISKAIADSTDDQGRTRAFTLIYTVGPSTALLLSPSLGGVLADQISLRSIFFAGAVAQAIAVLFFMRLRPVETRDGESAVSAGYKVVLTERPIVILCGLFLLLLLVLTTGFTLAPNYLETVHGIGVGTIGLFGSVFALGSVILGIVIGRVPLFNRPMNALLLTTALCPLSYGLLLAGGNIWVFALAYFCRAGYLVSWGLIYAALGEVTPERLRSRSFALAELTGGAGFAIAPFLAGALYEVEPSLPIVAALLATLPLLLALLAVRRYVHRLQPAAEAA